MGSSSFPLLAGLALGALVAAPAAHAEAKPQARPPGTRVNHFHVADVKLPRFEWPAPDLIDEVDIPGETVARGIPIRLHVLHLKHTQGELLQIYADAFARAGLFIPPDRDQVSGLGITLTGLDVKRRVTYSAIFEELADHTTQVTLGEANLARARDPDQDPGALPVCPGASHPLRTTSEVGSTMTFTVNSKTENVLRFYRTELGKLGYREPDVEGAPGLFARGKEEIQVTVRAKPSAVAPPSGVTTNSVILTRRLRGEDSPGAESAAQIGH